MILLGIDILGGAYCLRCFAENTVNKVWCLLAFSYSLFCNAFYSSDSVVCRLFRL